jgi:hypothetical protein
VTHGKRDRRILPPDAKSTGGTIMIKTTMTALIITATLLFTLVLRASDPAAEKKLQQAIDFLESKGDLARATPLFEQVSRSSDQELAARSLLYLGQIQERQGKDRARATYQRIVDEFANQRDAAAEAGRRLAGLGDVRSTSDAIVLSKIWASDNSPGADHTVMAISPDGRYVVAASKTGLLIHDVSLEKDRSLRSVPDSTKRFPITHPHFTPDGKRVVYVFGMDGVYEVRTINIDGTDEQTIMTIKDPGYFQVTAISPDGKLAAVGFKLDDSVRSASNRDLWWQVGTLSLQTGKLSILKGREGRTFVGNFSPDGRWLVYASVVSGEGITEIAPDVLSNSAIYTIAVDGSVENELVVQPTMVIDTPYFSPDGSKVLQVFRPGGATRTSLYSIPVADGKKLGPPQIVREGVPAGNDTWGPDVMGFARDGAFYVSELRNSRVVVWKIQNLFPQVSTKK